MITDSSGSTTNQTEKIAILGGGLGAIAAAFELSDPANEGRFEVTVYQLGWRLGGKCASGRDLELADRIEEHGIHTFFGFYDNCFEVMQRCYGELGRKPDQPMPTWEKAFEPHNLVVLDEFYDGKWDPWIIDFPTRPGVPGTPRDPHSLWNLLVELIEWIRKEIDKHSKSGHSKDHGLSRPHWWQRAVDEINHIADDTSSFGEEVAHLVHGLARTRAADPGEHTAEHHHWMHALLELLSRWAAHQRVSTDDHLLHRAYLMIEFAIANARGMFADGLLFHPFSTINRYDYREWLGRHGASKELLDSVVVRAFYELIFAYPSGDTDRPGNLEAGTQLGIFFRALTYRGALLWKMNAGMGDVVFAPLYEVLVRRGVKFEFFSRVTDLHVDADTNTLTGVTISRQVNVKKKPYDPLYPVKELPCWPSAPLYEQIVEGEELKKNKINLESTWTEWSDTGGKLELKAGEHFDKAILGIPIGSFPYICTELMAASSDWRAMVDKITTVQTQSLQLSFNVDLAGLGWKHGSPILGTYSAIKFENWADMTQVEEWESWPPDLVKNIAYMCGTMAGPLYPPKPDAKDFPAQQQKVAKNAALDFLSNHVAPLWPGVTANGGPGLDWTKLVAPDGVNGADRLGYQFVRVNIDPSERYVQSPRGSSVHRLKENAAGFEGLYLAGDWTDNGINLGCAEAATMSGRLAARYISGRDFNIPGSDF